MFRCVKLVKAKCFALALGLLLAATAISCDSPGLPSSPSPTPDPHLSLIAVVSTQTRLLGGDVTVVGSVKNGDTVGHDITLRAGFLDPSGQEIGSAQGVAEDISPGSTGSFQIDAKVDPARYGTTQVTVISLKERK